MSKTGKGGANRGRKKTLGRAISAGNVNPLDSVGFATHGGLDPISAALNAVALAYAKSMGRVKIVDKSTPATSFDQERFLKARDKRARRAQKRLQCQIKTKSFSV